MLDGSFRASTATADHSARAVVLRSLSDLRLSACMRVILSDGTIIAMPRTTLRAKGQLTLPEEIRKAARLEEGDLLEAELTAEGILLRPQKVIDATQAWFWTAEWQAGEREADADEAGGRAETFDSGAEFVEALRSIAKPSLKRRRRS